MHPIGWPVDAWKDAETQSKRSKGPKDRERTAGGDGRRHRASYGAIGWLTPIRTVLATQDCRLARRAQHVYTFV